MTDDDFNPGEGWRLVRSEDGWPEMKNRIVYYGDSGPAKVWVRENPLPTEFPREEAEAIIYRLLAASMNVTRAADLALDRLATLWEKRA